MPLQSFVYCSTATRDIGVPQLWPLLKKARVRNAQLGITGVLLYANGHFAQCLEGRAQDIDRIYAHVQRDAMHQTLISLVREDIDRRRFEQWTMGFGAVQTVAFGDPWSADQIAPSQMQALLNGNTRSQRMLRAFWDQHRLQAA